LRADVILLVLRDAGREARTRAFGRVRFRGEALRAVRDGGRLALDFFELRRDFIWLFRPDLRVPAFALRFAITGVLSAPGRRSVRPRASLTVYP